MINAIMKYIGVAEGEEFIVNGECHYKFENGNLLFLLNEKWKTTTLWDSKLLEWKLENIEKVPFKPNCGDLYWYWGIVTNTVDKTNFDINHSFDLLNYQIGNCYRTKEEVKPINCKWREN